MHLFIWVNNEWAREFKEWTEYVTFFCHLYIWILSPMNAPPLLFSPVYQLHHTLRHMFASGFSCSTRGGGCGSGGGKRGISTELLILLPRLLGTLPTPLVVRIPRFLPRLTRASGSTCTGSGSSTSDSVARWNSRNTSFISFHSTIP